MTSAPGGNGTLHAAIAAELAKHRLRTHPGCSECTCGKWVDHFDPLLPKDHQAHVAEQVLSVLTDLPTDQRVALARRLLKDTGRLIWRQMTDARQAVEDWHDDKAVADRKAGAE